MNDETKLNVIMALIVMLITMNCIIFFGILKQISTNIDLERLEMCSSSNANVSNYVNGVAFRDKYFCVWTQEQTEEQILETVNHEYVHILLSKDGKNGYNLTRHFCGG